MWTGVLLFCIASAGAITRDQFYPHGHGVDQRLPRGSSVSSPEISLNVPIVFFGETYETIFACISRPIQPWGCQSNQLLDMYLEQPVCQSAPQGWPPLSTFLGLAPGCIAGS